MISPNDQRMISKLEETIRNVSGVTEIYESRNLSSKLLAAGNLSYIEFNQISEGILVKASIGVNTSESAVETSRLAHLAIISLCEKHGYDQVITHVTVVHLDTNGKLP